MSASLGSRRRGRLRDGSCSGGFGPRRRRRRSCGVGGARLPFSRTVGILTSDGAIGEILVNDIISSTQARLPKPPLAYIRLILSDGYIFAPATDGTEIQYCSLWYAHSFTGSGRHPHPRRL
ncbi:hypothetical protein D1007_17070 [Hordeum vulgare]|nr:hypothetical protein D1007_17070 [Hordeum vulgare]